MATTRDRCGQELERIEARLSGLNGVLAPEEARALLSSLERLTAELGREREELRTALQRVTENQRQLDARFLAVEQSAIFRCLRAAGGFFDAWKRRAGRRLLHSPLHPLYLKLRGAGASDRNYLRWIEREQAALPSFDLHRWRGDQFERRPLFSILMPVHQPDREWLDRAVESVKGQSYTRWELCVCDDASGGDWLPAYFSAQAQADPRIRFMRLPQRSGIAGATNAAGALATGEYCGFLDQDDILSPYALHYVTEALQDGDADAIYTDEDILSAGGLRQRPVFKPGWSPDLLTSCMYFGHFTVIARAALERVGWLRPGFDGSQDYDLALRVTDGNPVVRHVPRILYHWRQHDGSTCGNPAAKPAAHDAGRRALEETVTRRGWRASVADGPHLCRYVVRREPPPASRISLIVCSLNPKLLQRFLRAVQRSVPDPRPEIVVVRHRSPDNGSIDSLAAAFGCREVCYDGPFHFAAMNNRGALAATGEVLVFMNDDTEPLDSGWLAALAGQAARPEVGAAGALLLYPSGIIQHAGIATGIMDGAGHPLRGCYESPYWQWAESARNVSAVTGACLGMRKRVFEELGGFDEAFPVNYNDLDLCLRARRAGYEIVHAPAAALRHYEGASRKPVTPYEERERLYRRWGHVLDAGDPYYNPNLTRVREDASLRMEEY